MNKLSSAVVGGLIAVMVLLNGTLSNALGNYQSSILIHATGGLGILLILLVRKTGIRFYKEVPKYAYLAGVIGVVPIIANNIGFRVLGVSITLALGLLGQSLISIVIDHYGLFGMEVIKFHWKKLIGLTTIIIGIIVMTIY